MTKNILEVKNLSFSYHTLSGETKVLNNISFSVKYGEFISIVGPSGCGKSTLLSLLSGMIKPEEGKIIFSDSPPLMSPGHDVDNSSVNQTYY